MELDKILRDLISHPLVIYVVKSVLGDDNFDIKFHREYRQAWFREHRGGWILGSQPESSGGYRISNVSRSNLLLATGSRLGISPCMIPCT